MINYQCDQCSKTDTSMAGWYMVRLSLLYQDPQAPNPPGGPSLEEQWPDFIFDTKGHRDQWLAAHNLSIPKSERNQDG